MNIPKSGLFSAFSLIVDINSFTRLVAFHDLSNISNYVHDVLIGSVSAIEDCGGSVIGVMGDAIFGVLESSDVVVQSCSAIAKDVNALCEYLAGTEYEEGVPGLPSLKIGIEYGTLSAATIRSDALGTIPFCIGPATNYAARILGAGKGNRCHVGPKAMQAGLSEYIHLDQFLEVDGKPGEPTYGYWQLDLSDIWIEGEPEDGIRYW